MDVINYFGLESILQLQKDKIKASSDVVVILCHWALASRGLSCVGLGENFKDQEKRSEMLPDSWNGDPSVYSLRFRNSEDEKYLLKAIKADNQLIISLLSLKNEASSDTSVTVNDFVVPENGYCFKQLEVLVKQIKEELINKVIQSKYTEQKSQLKSDDKSKRSDGKDTGPDPLIDGTRGTRNRVDPYYQGEGLGAPALGRSDLDPLGGIMGGGMLMDPRQGGRLGNPMQPRIDPVGPGFGGIDPMGGGGFGGLGPTRGGGGSRNFGDAMRPPSWDNMYM